MKASLIRPSLIVIAALLIAPAIASAQVMATTTAGVAVESAASKATGPQFFANLVLGSAGADVKRLQQYLNTHGCPVAQSGPGSYQEETTYFGPATKAALQCFQRDTGLITPTGNLGVLTREYISTLP